MQSQKISQWESWLNHSIVWCCREKETEETAEISGRSQKSFLVFLSETTSSESSTSVVYLSEPISLDTWVIKHPRAREVIVPVLLRHSVFMIAVLNIGPLSQRAFSTEFLSFE